MSQWTWTRRQVLGAGGLAGLFGLSSAGLFARVRTVAAQAPPSPAPSDVPRIELEIVEDGGAWQVVVYRVEEQTAVGVQYPILSAEGTQAYIDSVRLLGPEAFDYQPAIPVIVTLTRPMGLDRFLELMAEAGATGRQYQFRYVLPDGTAGNIFGAPEPDGTLLDPAHVQAFVDGIAAARGVPVILQGAISADIVIDRAGYDTLVALPDEVYLVDVMRAIAHRAATAAGVHDVPMDSIMLRSQYDYLEANGLMNG